jgi:uncharacterized membrane protein (UPF0127 family)
MLKEILINNKKFKLAIADTENKRKKGLSGLPKLGKNKGMLFIFPDPKNVWMIMKDMNFDLDFIFLDSNFKVLQLASLSKDDKEGIESNQPINMVLEVNKGVIKENNLKIGNILKPTSNLSTHKIGVEKFKSGGVFQKVGDIVYKVKVDDIKIEKNKLQVLNENGEVSANIEPDARIFSREHTKAIIEKVKRNRDEDLGQLMIQIFNKHDSQTQEYVKK